MPRRLLIASAVVSGLLVAAAPAAAAKPADDRATGIIAVLIGVKAAPEPLQVGPTKGSAILPYIEPNAD